MPKACGEVTSWIKWASIYRTAGAPGSCETTWVSHTFSNNVFAKGRLLLKVQIYKLLNGSGWAQREPPGRHHSPTRVCLTYCRFFFRFGLTGAFVSGFNRSQILAWGNIPEELALRLPILQNRARPL